MVVQQHIYPAWRLQFSLEASRADTRFLAVHSLCLKTLNTEDRGTLQKWLYRIQERIPPLGEVLRSIGSDWMVLCRDLKQYVKPLLFPQGPDRTNKLGPGTRQGMSGHTFTESRSGCGISDVNHVALRGSFVGAAAQPQSTRSCCSESPLKGRRCVYTTFFAASAVFSPPAFFFLRVVLFLCPFFCPQKKKKKKNHQL